MNYLQIFEHEGLNYEKYRGLIDQLLAEGKTTGEDHSESMLQYAKMNVQRMNRLDKTTNLSAEILETLTSIKGMYKFLVITEGWCGDAAQIVPVINKIVEAAPNFEMKLVLRDEHLPLIDAHLTNGGRAIPVLLVLDRDGQLALQKWGPRPAVLQDLMAQWKADGIVMPELSEHLHGWYAKDKTAAIQKELSGLLAQLK
jgi:hypothetical protein